MNPYTLDAVVLLVVEIFALFSNEVLEFNSATYPGKSVIS